MIITTTSSIEGKPASQYMGVVAGEVIIGANIVKDFFAGIRDIVGGRSGSYEKILQEGRETAISEMIERATAMGADAITGVDIDYETIGTNGSMLMVSASGTAIKF